MESNSVGASNFRLFPRTSAGAGRFRFWSILVVTGLMLLSESSWGLAEQAGETRTEQNLPSGFRQLVGQHVTLITDLPSDPAIDELPRVFDAALMPWCEYFQVPAEQTRTWKLRGYLIQDRDRFVAAGLIPAELPDFLHGFQRGDEFWCLEQPSAYYRRHLVLHEGTHAFMSHFLGGWGPTWYMEGMAEYLATHSWDEGRLELGIMPRGREMVPHWGRVRLIREQWDAGRRLSLVEIMQFPPSAHLRMETYGWCWAAVQFFDRHPDYQRAFRLLQREVRDESIEFSRNFARRLNRPWSDVELQWRDFIARLDYGYDVPRAVLRFASPRAFDAWGADVDVQADQGWQSSGLRVEAGQVYQIIAQGRIQVHDTPRPWISEADGVTIRYVDGRPLGVLLAMIVPSSNQVEAVAALSQPWVVGRERRVTPTTAGTLYFRINDAPSELAENRGELVVRVTPIPADR